ncbi:M91 family zinc metallopeptidase [Streptomyces luteireticuli]|uniref:M91 family zinc metallopeptidase n=1 Tax=Streptomyces luteireticuli TaxID=173858 RepID=UPI0035575B50
MPRPTGIDPARLAPPRPVRAAAEPPTAVTWIDGEPLPVTVIRPGIAVCPDPATVTTVLPTANPRPDLALRAEEYIREIDFLLRRIESSEAGQRLVEFLGHARPLPDPDGSYGGPDDWVSGLNRRVLCGPRGSRKNDRTLTQRDLAGINVIIMQATDGDPAQWSLQHGGTGPQYDGRGAFSAVAFHPRVMLLVDDVPMAPEVTLAHELVHCAHALAGTTDETGKDTAERRRIRQEATNEAVGLFREKYGTGYQQSKRNPNPAKVPRTGKTETHAERMAFYDKTFDELFLRRLHPLPVAETAQGLVVLRDVFWEEIRTHGSDVALEWIDGIVQIHEGRRISPSPAEVRAERLAFDHHARAVVRAGRRDEDALAALRDAAATWYQRKRVRGVSEVAIARDLGFRHRIAYVALTKVQNVCHLAVPRDRIPHRVFAGASSFVYAHDTTSLDALAAALSTADPATADSVRAHRDELGAARPEHGSVLEQRGCRRGPDQPAETSRTHWVNPDSVPAELREQIGVIIHRARSGTSAKGKASRDMITDVYEGRAVGTPRPGQGRPGFVAMVPAKVDDHDKLLALARRYRDEATGTRQGCALVIGLNEGYHHGEKEAERATRAARQQKIIDKFVEAWQQERDSIPVAVLSFLWRAPQGAKLNDQKTIPYGAIRQTIAASERTRAFVEALYADGKGCERVYLHTGDADVLSLKTPGNTPLFDAAATLLEAAALREKGTWPDLFSGGYRLPAGGDPRVDIATGLDRAVRVAMAKTEPRTVYFPEPNTFIKLEEGAHELEPGVTFGIHDQEGEHLAKTLADVRAASRRLFDPECSVATDGTRLVQRIKDLPPATSISAHIKTLRQSYTQSHARKEEWGKRALDFYDVAPRPAKDLSDLVFAVPDDGELRRLSELDRESFEKDITESRRNAFKAAVKEKKIGEALPAEHLRAIGAIAVQTHEALLRGYVDAYRRLAR